MSKTLSRLRALFGDALFTRSSHGMQATPRTRDLQGELAGILEGVHQLVTGKQFEPLLFAGTVTLALPETIGLVLLPELVRKLHSQAPGLAIRVITRVESQLEQLALGKLDFAVHVEHSHYGNDFKVEKLGVSPATLLARVDHPLTAGDISWKRLAEFPLIRLYVPDIAQLEMPGSFSQYTQLLATEQGSLEISHLLTALEILRNTDSIMPCPAFIMQNEGATRDIHPLPIPGTDLPGISYALVAHNRTMHSPLHNWLWGEITCTIRDLRTPHARKMRQRVAAGSTDPL